MSEENILARVGGEYVAAGLQPLPDRGTWLRHGLLYLPSDDWEEPQAPMAVLDG